MKSNKNIEVTDFHTVVEGQQLKSISYEYMGQRIVKEFYHSQENWIKYLYPHFIVGFICGGIISWIIGGYLCQN